VKAFDSLPRFQDVLGDTLSILEPGDGMPEPLRLRSLSVIEVGKFLIVFVCVCHAFFLTLDGFLTGALAGDSCPLAHGREEVLVVVSMVLESGCPSRRRCPFTPPSTRPDPAMARGT
jgi:hypothetical protein